MNVEKALDVMHYFVNKLGGVTTDVKLMKLMYFADRKALLDTGFPITDDSYYIMNRGPILSSSLDLINHCPEEFLSVFENPTNKNEGGYPVKEINLRRDSVRQHDYLAEIEMEILDEIFNELGGMTTNEIVRYAHNDNFCPEWNFPEGRAKPLPIDAILHAHGVAREEAINIVQDINYYR
ncbi:Panacea domain-containing protein [Aeromonas caviae]|uniref:Panacea domain-containing protein n=1 Tax=Aeromonas caviae TaxID=648 RepID=UPI003014A793